MDLDVERLLGAVERTVVPGARRTGRSRGHLGPRDDSGGPLGRRDERGTNPTLVPASQRPPRTGVGGRYQLEGNAGGTIGHCERPSHLGLTWEFGGDVSWVEARLCNDGTGRSRLAITHTALVSDHWHKFGPGAVGVGWEMGLLGMELHLTRPNEPKLDGATFHTTRDGKALIVGSSAAWGRAAEAAGTDADVARAAAQVRRPFTRATRSRRIDASFRRARRPGALRCYCRCVIGRGR